MIPVTPPKGATMAYRLDPYSLDLIPSKKTKTMHDVVDPTVVFWHKRNPSQPSPYTKKSGHSPNHLSSAPMTPKCSTPQTPHRAGHVTPPPCASASPVSSLRNVSISTRTQRIARVLAPFRVAPGDEVVVRTGADTEVLAVVNAIGRPDEIISPEKASSSLRLVRKAREGDRRHQAQTQGKVRELLASTQRILHSTTRQADVSVHEGEYSLDGLTLYIAVSTDLPDGELLMLQRTIGNHLQQSIRFINTTTSHSAQSSPNLSDCSSSVASSSSRCPSVILEDDLEGSTGGSHHGYAHYPHQ